MHTETHTEQVPALQDYTQRCPCCEHHMKVEREREGGRGREREREREREGERERERCETDLNNARNSKHSPQEYTRGVQYVYT